MTDAQTQIANYLKSDIKTLSKDVKELTGSVGKLTGVVEAQAITLTDLKTDVGDLSTKIGYRKDSTDKLNIRVLALESKPVRSESDESIDLSTIKKLLKLVPWIVGALGLGGGGWAAFGG